MIYLTHLCLLFLGAGAFALRPGHGTVGAARRTLPQLQATTASPPKVQLSPLVENMAVSKTIEIHALTKEMEKNGQTVYSLCVGEPDYEPPTEVLAATEKAATGGHTKYTAVNGDAALRQAIADDLRSRKGLSYTADQIVIANGAKQSVIQTLLAVVCPGDDVIIPAPYWPSYPDMVKMCGARPVVVESSAANGYVMTAADLRATLAKHPKATCMIFCNPSNPTGAVAGKKDLEEMVAVLQVLVLSDEIYEQLTYDIPHVSVAALPGMMDRTVTVNGFSKSHSMTGYRIGYSAGPTAVAKATGKLQSQMTSCASSIGQQAALAALRETSPSWITDRVKELKDKRDLALRLVGTIPDVTCPVPNGAFYIMPDVHTYYGKKTAAGRPVGNSHELCLELLREEQVGVVSGDSFGAPDTIRISYAASTELITESVSRLKKFLLSLK